MLHLNRTLRGPIAYGDRLVIHPQPAAGTDNWYLPLEVLPKSKFGSMPMEQPLGDACGEAEGEPVALYLLPHGLFDEGDLDSVGFDLLAERGEVGTATRGRMGKGLAHGNDYRVYYLYWIGRA